MDNSEKRLNNVFFYGLYMDPAILKAKGIDPRDPRKAIAKGYRLRVGKMATLFRDAKAEACGLVYALTHDEINKLYRDAGLSEYVPESLLVELEGGGEVAVLCCNLLVPPEEVEENPEYLGKLIECMGKLGLPAPNV